MKRFVIVAVLAILFLSAAAFAEDGSYENAGVYMGLSTYKPMYFSLGWGSLYQNLGTTFASYSDDLVKVSVSMKYDPFYRWHSGLFMAYTQTMFWDTFGYSGPFEEIDFNPELFWRLESGYNLFGDVKIPLLDFLQAGWEHKSNGQNEPLSRGYDRLYGQIQLGLGENIHFALGAKWFHMIDTDWFDNGFLSLRDNPDIQMYTSSWEFQALLSLGDHRIFLLPSKFILSVGPGGGANAFDFSLGWQQLEVYLGKFIGDFRPYIQVWNGYGQSMIDYNQAALSAHAGLALEF